MALVDPYSPCPCGSGQKYKWCCQKVEAYVERAQRLLDSGQYESAMKPLEEGLAKVPDNLSLLLRKALVHLHLNQAEPARHALRFLLQKHPAHLGGSILLTRLALETEGPAQAVAQFQQALRPSRRKTAGSLARWPLSSARHWLRLACPRRRSSTLSSPPVDSDDGKQAITSLQSLKADTTISVWEKNPYRLSPPPDRVSEPFRESFDRALGWAEEGLWSAAASAFELLAAGTGAGAFADRNRGLCCLWLADHDGAVAALRRYIMRRAYRRCRRS